MAVAARELAAEPGMPPGGRELLATLSDQVARCKAILATLADCAGQARAEAGQRRALDRYLMEVWADWQRLRPTVSARVAWEGVRPVPEIVADRTLSQAIVNLLNNAADASPGQVEVDGRWSADELVLEIRDRGPGLPADAAARLGRAFHSDKAPGEGLGLGLCLAHAAVDRLGGSIRLFPRAEGGVRALLTLPLGGLLVGARA
jgi:two-component system, sensor histidine kinase RegB